MRRIACLIMGETGSAPMIVSHAHRYVFVPIPKTGTHAVRQALREHMGPDDIEQVGLFVDRKFPWPELAALEREEIAIISGYLPKQMDEAAVADAIKAAIAETGAATMKDLGKVVAALKAKYTGQMDFAKASAAVKAALGG